MICDEVVKLLKDQVKPALGCTEPVAVALAVARARETVTGDIQKISVRVSLSIYKNGMGVSIPGALDVGLGWAAALGAVAGDSSRELQVVEDTSGEKIDQAAELIKAGKVTIFPDVELKGVYVEAQVTAAGGSSRVVITGSHSNVVDVRLNDQVIYHREVEGDLTCSPPSPLGNMSLSELRILIETIPFRDIEFLEEGVHMNLAAAREGLSMQEGLTLGKGLRNMMQEGILTYDLVGKIRMVSASAADARMSGRKVPVMTSGGSGNQGIVAIIPVTEVAGYYRVGREKLIRGLAFSHLINILIKDYTGKLSAACGCAIAAGIGASAAIAWLLGCDDNQISGAIKNMAGNLCGMICDGAKGSCAFKLATASSEAVIAGYLARQGIIIPPSTGIISVTAEDTMRNIGKVCAEGMALTDNTIVSVMMKNINLLNNTIGE
ncbi:MAG: serine dehydratase subunit alpha family protein [Bacillota bacterium]